jgi:hypothetical protein
MAVLETERTVEQLLQWQRPMHYQNRPLLRQAVARLNVIRKKPMKLGLVLHTRVLAMLSTLNLFMDEELKLGWKRASVVAARVQGFKGENRARNIWVWIHNFLASGLLDLPRPAYRGNKDSLLNAEDLSSKLTLWLLEKQEQRGTRHITAQDVVNFIHSDEIQCKHRRVSITEHTACCWLHRMDWRYGKTPKGMYVDRHKRPDIVDGRVKLVNRWYNKYKP